MRMAIAVAFFSAASFLAVGLASAVPLALGDQAALARDASAGQWSRRPAATRTPSAMPGNTRAATTGPTIPIGGPISTGTSSSTTL